MVRLGPCPAAAQGPTLLLAGALLTPPYLWFRYRLDLRRQLWREWVER
jgi:hypothetical protein